MKRANFTWILLAVTGLVVAVAVSVAASKLSEPQVGLTSEPVTAGERLAPRTRATTPADGRTTTTETPTTPTTTTDTRPTRTVPDDDESDDDEGAEDDDSGRGRGRGRGRGEDDGDDD